MITATIVLIFIFLVIACLCSAIETAFTAASPAKIHKIKSEGNKSADISLELIKIKEKVISTCLILYSLLNTVATTIATGLFIMLYGEETGTIVSSIVMASLIIIFAEVLPKAIAVARPEKIVILSSKIVKCFLYLMYPINYALDYFVKGFCFVFRINLSQSISPVDEVKGIIKHYQVEGDVQKVDKNMIDAVLDITHMSVDEIMIHRSKMVTLQHDLPIESIISQALAAEYTKIPLWKDNSDNIISVLNVRTLMHYLYEEKIPPKQIVLNKITQEAWFIPDSLLVSQMLQNFKLRDDKAAFVVDEYGDLQGMVTVDDVVKEILGNIHDIGEKGAEGIRELDNSYIIDGATTVREINRELDWNLPEDDANTIAGLIINHMGAIPEKGEQLTILGLNITIRKKVANKILSVSVQKISSDSDE